MSPGISSSSSSLMHLPRQTGIFLPVKGWVRGLAVHKLPLAPSTVMALTVGISQPPRFGLRAVTASARTSSSCLIHLILHRDDCNGLLGTPAGSLARAAAPTLVCQTGCRVGSGHWKGVCTAQAHTFLGSPKSVFFEATDFYSLKALAHFQPRAGGVWGSEVRVC